MYSMAFFFLKLAKELLALADYFVEYLKSVLKLTITFAKTDIFNYITFLSFCLI